ncbi:MAG: hypothetical protein A2504_13170 [Bdellovibrionales bacterium RIFOXYD12_FULL_39_22]|nr:MAG: hypothetical protein A2385_00970 [Bdellovibrionales bacterium RIFOXYB1_FULL_39_21]OFZ43578.1 MAG: hypothetical protein A2485_12640 [Bdellovibrionales bacterium RIFOXYC12_FULL_39_17]OFZ44597.1 MAG: hypothetical protein A2404_10330 [Bdellovibrionales bacterium RIFOXYC1_FULL_39_130]OFZ72394.1 MAG: hypothetical protein A2451_11465 [Bdellovibrionales bacterium RIFOXYC2_FULL_39_8]OFZ76356.1 MAG: hypothetical protein A2560_06950 [Bdellovibrionales bacterium RIFOXYD1_FULL_39_84]OFZ94622.1 MAG:
MLIKLQLKKNDLSSWLLIFFLVAIVILSTVSDLFQTPVLVGHDVNRYKFLFDKDELKNVSAIDLKNNLTNVSLGNQKTHWQMTAPKSLPANEETVQKIISAIEGIKIREVHTLDQINISHFSLDNPLMQISFKFDNAEAILKMKFGLINSIDNLTYVTLSDKDAIYEVEAVKLPIESYDLAEFIESRPMPFNISDIEQLEIYRGSKKQNILQLSIHQKDGIWLDRANSEIASEQVNQYLQQLTAVRSYMIIDSVTDEQKKIIDDYLSNLAYSVYIQIGGQEFALHASNIIGGIADLKIEKKLYFIVAPEDRAISYLLHKDVQSIFSKRQSDFPKSSAKRPFD